MVGDIQSGFEDYPSNQANHVVGDIQSGFKDYQVEDHQIFSDPFTNGSTAGFVNTNGYGGAYGNDGGFQSQSLNQDEAFAGSFAIDGGFDPNIPNAFGTNMTGGGSISDAYNFGSGNTVPYPIQTSWPHEYQGHMGSSSFHPSLAQTPAATSAGAEYNEGYFGNSQFDMGTFNDGSYGYVANNDNIFNAGNVDGNFVDDSFFGSNSYGN